MGNVSFPLPDEEELSTEQFQGVRLRGEPVKALPTPAQRKNASVNLISYTYS
jgi:hypothetical protein